MNISGFQKTSLIDYPGEICSIIFTQGCNFRCPYCHNPELVEPQGEIKFLDVDEILSHIEGKKDVVSAVCITGGEPTIQHDLIEFINKLKKIGVKVKLDSNGTNPEVLRELIDLQLLDYIAMDIKAPIDAYEQVVSRSVVTKNILKSVEVITVSDIRYEFRTTILKTLLDISQFDKIGELISGADLYVLQQFHKTKTLRLDGALEEDLQYSKSELRTIQEVMKRYVKKCIIRF